MAKKRISFPILALLFQFSCAHLSRGPAAEFERVRVFSQVLPGGSKLVIVGIDETADPDRFEVSKATLAKVYETPDPQGPVAIRPSELGFDAPPDVWISPKYLVTRGDRVGPQKIFAFEGKSTRLKYTWYGNKQEFKEDSFDHADLPKELVEVGAARQQLLKATLYELALSVVNYSPLIPLTVVLKTKHDEFLKWAQYHASYWERWINQALDNPGSMPEFEKNFTNDDLVNIGFALSIRFNHNWTLKLFGSERWEGILMSERDPHKVDLFNVYRGLKKDETDYNMGQLVKIANEQGLIVIPYGPNIALLFYDKTNMAPKEHWRALNIDSKSPQEIEAARKKTQIDRGNLVPIGIYVLTQSGGPLQLTDLNDPLKVGLRSRVYETYKFARNMGYALFLTGEVAFGLRIAEAGVKWVLRKAGKPWLEYQLSNYAELDVLLDSGLVSLDPESVVMDSFCSNLQSYGIAKDRRDQLCREVQENRLDPNALKLSIDKVLTEISRAEAATGRWAFARDGNLEKQRLLSAVQLLRFSQTPKKLLALGDQTTKRDMKLLAVAKKQALQEVVDQQRHEAEQEWAEERIATLPHTDKKSLIVFMVDGLAAGELEKAVNLLPLPNLKKYFVDQGYSYNTFTPRAISMSSWATILTGFEPTETGMRSDQLASKMDFKPETLRDARKDLLLPEYIKDGRSHRKLIESGVEWLPRMLKKEEVLMNFTPINDGGYPPIVTLLTQVPKNVKDLLFGTFEDVNILDKSSAESTASAIEKNPGKYRLVMNWYATLDSHTHYTNATKFRAFKVVDEAIGKVIEAARRDPVLRDASMILISDHGFRGGLAIESINRPFTESGDYVNNTAFNLTKFFAGDVDEYSNLRFVVAAAESPEPKFDFKYLKEFLIQPFSYQYRGSQKNKGMKNILIDYTGDRLAQIYLRRGENFDIGDRMSLYELQNFDSSQYGAGETFQLNFPQTLLNYRVRSVETTSEVVRKRLRDLYDNRPVEFFAMPLGGLRARESVDALTAGENNKAGPSDRPPVLICALPWKCGVVLTKRDGPVDLYRYVVIRDLQQYGDGTVSGQVSDKAEDDPIGYLGKIMTTEDYSQWYSDRDWVRKAQNEPYPTIIFGMSESLTNAPRLAASLERESEIPDFLVTANEGFNFNSSTLTEGDHGAFHRDEARIPFILNGLGNRSLERRTFDDPRLARDVGQTMIEILGVGNEFATQGQSVLGRVNR